MVTIRLIFSTVHGSIRFSCSEASRGGRRFAFFDRRPASRAGGPLVLAELFVRVPPVAGVTAAAPVPVPAGRWSVPAR